MNVIVPLAGPGFFQNNKIKALQKVNNDYFLRYILKSRPWINEVSQLVFVLKRTDETILFSRNFLEEWFPQSTIVFIDHYTNGAAFSSLCGIPHIKYQLEPLIVDLADIYYTISINIRSLFQQDHLLKGIGLTFPSDKEIYSYLQCKSPSSTSVIKSAEKSVISNNASAGTYIYKDATIYLNAMAYCLQFYDKYHFDNLLYVCPLFNGVIANKGRVLKFDVENHLDIKFKSEL